MAKAKSKHRHPSKKLIKHIMERIEVPPPIECITDLGWTAPPARAPLADERIVGADITRHPPQWMMWWHRWRFRQSLRHAEIPYGAYPGWRRRCLTAVQTQRYPTKFEYPAQKDVPKTIARRIEAALYRVRHFWHWYVTDAWLDEA